MPIPNSLTDFNIAESEVRVWLFRPSGSSNDPVYTGHWIETNDDLDEALRTAASDVRASLVEALEYDILAPIEPGQALTIDANETFAGRILDAASEPLPNKRAQQLSHMRNTKFYVVKFTNGDNALHAVRKADDSWSTRKSRGRLPVIFSDHQLALEPDPAFNLSRYIDLFIAGDDLVILDKGAFEGLLFYKQAHIQDFGALQAEPAFANLFTDMAPLAAFVGTNKLHLRRVSAIRQKAHFQNAAFMQNLREHYEEAGLSLTFDADGKIVPTELQCPHIITALLNHRLYSLFSQGYFDVQHAMQV